MKKEVFTNTTYLYFSGLGLESIGICIFLVFLAMKLLGDLDISWFYVTLPLWLPIAANIALYLTICIIYVLILMGCAIVSMIVAFINHLKERKRDSK